jgi:hypothetical protein
VAAAQGKRIAKKFDDVGAWQLDCNSTYGGCEIQQITNKGGGVNNLTKRLTPAVFCEAVHFSEGINRNTGLSGPRRARKRKRAR